MPTLILIPARFQSSRFPGKPLAELRGAGGTRKPLVLRTWEAAKRAAGTGDRVVIATDDRQIRLVAEAAGAECILTSSICRTGTDRCAEALATLDPDYRFDVVVNLQGDAPLTPPWFIPAIADALRKTPEVDVSTPVLACNAESEAQLREDRRCGRVGATTAVMDRRGHALYFSKEVLPHGGRGSEVLHHVGAYAYRPEALRRFARWPTGWLEAAEELEQLRFLENGCTIFCVRVDSKGRAFWEVNNPGDIAIVERCLQEIGVA